MVKLVFFNPIVSLLISATWASIFFQASKLNLSLPSTMSIAAVLGIRELCDEIFGHFDTLWVVVRAVGSIRCASKSASAALTAAQERIEVDVDGAVSVAYKYHLAGISIKTQFVRPPAPYFIKRIDHRGQGAAIGVVHVWKCGNYVETNVFALGSTDFIAVNRMFGFAPGSYRVLLRVSGEPKRALQPGWIRTSKRWEGPSMEYQFWPNAPYYYLRNGKSVYATARAADESSSFVRLTAFTW